MILNPLLIDMHTNTDTHTDVTIGAQNKASPAHTSHNHHVACESLIWRRATVADRDVQSARCFQMRARFTSVSCLGPAAGPALRIGDRQLQFGAIRIRFRLVCRVRARVNNAQVAPGTHAHIGQASGRVPASHRDPVRVCGAPYVKHACVCVCLNVCVRARSCEENIWQC